MANRIPNRSTRHVVIHQDRQAGRLSIHDCHLDWTLRQGVGQDVVISRIVTGSHPEIIYGSKHPIIIRRVDRLWKERIKKGKCFRNPHNFRFKTREEMDLLYLPSELYFAIKAPGPPRRVGKGWEVTRKVCAEEREKDTSSLWSSYYLKSHQCEREGWEVEARQLRQEMLEKLKCLCQTLFKTDSERWTKVLEPRFLKILGRKVKTGGGGLRPAFSSPKKLAIFLAAAFQHPKNPQSAVRNIEKQISLASPYSATLASKR